MEYRKLSQVANIRQGRYYYENDEDYTTHYLVKSGNIVSGIFCPVPPFNKINISNKITVNELKENDILLCHMGSHIGKISLFHHMGKGPFACNQTVTIVRPTHIDPLYLYSYLSTYIVSTYLSISSKDIGRTTGKYIEKSKLHELPILLLPDVKQQWISNAIGAYVGLQKKAIEIKGQIEESMVKHIKSSQQR